MDSQVIGQLWTSGIYKCCFQFSTHTQICSPLHFLFLYSLPPRLLVLLSGNLNTASVCKSPIVSINHIYKIPAELLILALMECIFSYGKFWKDFDSRGKGGSDGLEEAGQTHRRPRQNNISELPERAAETRSTLRLRWRSDSGRHSVPWVLNPAERR